MKLAEQELEFDFGNALVERLDDPAKRRPEGMKFVDFLVEEEHRIVMLEVKDPSCKPKAAHEKAQVALERERAEFMKKIANDTLIAQELTPKARDSYTWLHLMKRDAKPLLYVFLLGAEKLPLEPALLLGFKDRLLANLHKEADQPWARRYVADCLVLTEATWADAFPQYPLNRRQ